MSAIRTGFCLLLVGVCACAASSARGAVNAMELRDLSLDKPIVLDQFVDYRLRNVTVAGVRDCAALTLTGRIRSVLIEQSTFGKIFAGPQGKAAGIECAGAMVGKLIATETTFFDAEHQLALLKEGSFGRVRFERCRFNNSDSFLKQIYALNPWRSAPPTAEFHNIERLELLDNEYANTTVIIHPSVKQVILRGTMPGLRVQNSGSTQVIHLRDDQLAESIPSPPDATVAVLE